MVWNEILFYGDSLSFGSRDEYGRCFPLEMIKIFGRYDVKLIPIIEAFPGYTSSQLLKMAGKVAFEYKDVKEVVLQFGTNDTKNKFPINRFKNNVEDILDIFFDKQVYFIQIPKPKGFGSNSYQNTNLKLIEQYNRVIEDIKRNNVHIVRLNECTYVDGIHFRNETNTKVASQVFLEIKKNRSF